MDLAIGAKQVFVMMPLFARDGASQLVQACTYPLTGRACVNRLYASHAVIDLGPYGARALATYGMALADLEAHTSQHLHD